MIDLFVGRKFCLNILWWRLPGSTSPYRTMASLPCHMLCCCVTVNRYLFFILWGNLIITTRLLDHFYHILLTLPMMMSHLTNRPPCNSTDSGWNSMVLQKCAKCYYFFQLLIWSHSMCSTSAVRRMFSAGYAGADPLRQRCVRTQRRNVIRSRTRIQWSSRRSGVMRCERLTENTSRAAALKMDCSLYNNWRETTASTEQQ